MSKRFFFSFDSEQEDILDNCSLGSANFQLQVKTPESVRRISSGAADPDTVLRFDRDPVL